MGDRLHRRPRSPPLHNRGISSMPTLSYLSYADPSGDPYSLSPRPESAVDPRNPAPVVTTYKVKPEYASASRDCSRHRGLILDGTSRPYIINAAPRSSAVHDGAGRLRPLHDPQGGEFYSIPASSWRHRSHRHDYSRTMDDADVSQRGMQVGESGRQSASYIGRSRRGYPGTLVRRGDSVAEDYGDDGYGYTNLRDLAQYDLDQSPSYPSRRRDIYEGSRPARSTSIPGYKDPPPRSYDNRERGPPPTTRRLNRISSRAPQYESVPVRAPQGEVGLRSPRREQFYEVDSPREHRSRRPVIHHDRPREERYYDPRDEDLRGRREIPHQSRRYNNEIDQHASVTRPGRTESNEYEKRREPSKKKEYERYGNYETYDDRAERRSERENGRSKGKDSDKYDDSDHKKRKRTQEKLATGISLSAAALGIDILAKNVKHEDSDDDREQKEESRRRRGDDSHRNRWDTLDDKEIIYLSGRDPQERPVYQDDKEPLADQRSGQRERTPTKNDLPLVEMSGRNPVENDVRNEADESKESRKEKTESVTSDVTKHPKGDSRFTEEDIGPRRPRKSRGSAAAFNPKDALDLRALRDALNNRDTSSAREGSFERERPKEPSKVPVDSALREDRGRRDQGESADERPPHLRVVSPPRDIKKLDGNKPKGILRQPRERFPEEPVAIREGVAPPKDAGKDGIPPGARWTKISRRVVNPDALDAGKERYEAREDFVIVLRVLTKEEIQAYAIATQQIRDNAHNAIHCLNKKMTCRRTRKRRRASSPSS